MSTIAIFLVQQVHPLLLAKLYDNAPRTTKLPILTLQIWWLVTSTLTTSVSTDTFEEAKTLHKVLQTILPTGGFN